MKKLLLLLALQATTLANLTEESLFIHDPNSTHLKFLRQHIELTVDHVNENGYELYGPTGTKAWLESIGIDFDEMILIEEAISGYPSSEEVYSLMRNLSQKHPEIFKLINIGQSENGQDLLVMKISDNPQVDELEPEVKLVANMHGNEIMGREVLIQFLEDVAKNYKTNARIKSIVDHNEIFIMPSLNPDGADKKRRGNANYVDLNRNFPDFTRPNDNRNRQSETVAMMNFQAKRNFTLSANYHGGAVVVNYPWDTSGERHPEDELVVDISKEYAVKAPYFLQRSRFRDAITNGYDWYEVNGGMQDWSYHWYNDLQITIEVSRSKWPSYSEREFFYQENKESILSFIERTKNGIGLKLSKNAKIELWSNDNKIYEFQTFNNEFYKVLKPGVYTFKIFSEGLDKEIVVDTTSSNEYRDYISIID